MKEIIILLKLALPLFRNRQFLIHCILSVATLAVGIFANIYTPILFKNIVQKLYSQNFSFIFLVVAGYAILWIISQSNMHIKEFFSSKVELDITTSIVQKCIAGMLNMPFKKFHASSASNMFGIIQRTEKAIPLIFVPLFFYIIPTIIELICITFIVATYYKFFYAVILLITLAVFLTYNLFFQKILDKLSQKLIIASDKTNSKILDYLINYETIKSFSLEKRVGCSLHQQLCDKKEIFTHTRGIYALVRSGQVIILGLGVLMIVSSITQDVYIQSMEPGGFILLTGYLMQLVFPINAIGYTLKDFKKSLMELKDAIKIIPENLSNLPSININQRKIDIVLKNILLIHKNHKILDSFSLTIPHGKKIILSGKSGAGKSTIAKLLMGLYPAKKGDITINNRNIKYFSSSQLCEFMTYIPQETQLLNASLKENLLLTALNHPTEQAINQAIKLAQLEIFVEKRLGGSIIHNIGDRGMQISGGEKQRIAIARLFLRQEAQVVILDEPFAALDKETIKIVYSNILSIFQNRTIIIITHQILQSMKKDFEIIQLEHL